jgi:hypothetical protein
MRVLNTPVATANRPNNDAEPIFARFGKRTPKAIIADILEQAKAKNRIQDVAEYLVDARLRSMVDKVAATDDASYYSRGGPLRVGRAFIEVTVSKPEKQQIERITHMLGERSMRVWLIVTLAERENWQCAIEETFALRDRDRVVVTDVEMFLCHAISVRGGFEPTAEYCVLKDIIKIYNERLPPREASGLRIVSIDDAR